MNAMRYSDYGGPDVLRYEDVEDPRPSRGQVLLQVAATSYHQLDATIRSGALRQVFPVHLPHVPGFDVSGTVAKLGADVEGLRGRRSGGGLPALHRRRGVGRAGGRTGRDADRRTARRRPRRRGRPAVRRPQRPYGSKGQEAFCS